MRISKQQKEKLRDLVAGKPQLRAGKFNAHFTYKDAQREWELIGLTLNAIPGAQKDWKAWRKTWQDIDSKVKAKSVAVKRVQRGTGGGPPPDNLDDFEEGVAALLHPHSIAGHSGVTESLTTFDGFEQSAGAGCSNDAANVSLPLQDMTFYEVDEVTQTDFPHPLETTSISGTNLVLNLAAPPPPVIATDVALDLHPPPAFQDTATPQPEKPKTKNKLTLKSMLKEKVLLKKEMLAVKKQMLEEKKKFHAAFLNNMERQTKAMEDISKSIQNTLWFTEGDWFYWSLEDLLIGKL